MPVDPKLDLLPAFENFDDWSKTLPQEQQDAFSRHLELTPEDQRDAEKKQLAGIGLVSQRTGLDPSEVSRNFESYYMPAFSRDKNGLNLAVLPKDAGEFYTAAKAKLGQEKITQGITLEGVKAAYRGEDYIQSLQKWQAANKGQDASAFSTGYQNAIGNVGQHLDFAGHLLGLMESNTGKTVGGERTAQPASREQAAEFDGALAHLATMKPRERKKVYAIIGARAEAAGYDQKGFFAQMLGELGKGIARAGSTVGTQAGIAGDVASNLPALLAQGMTGNADFGPTTAEQTAMDSSIAKRHAMGEVYDEVANVVAGTVDPVKATTGWMNETVEKGLISGPGAVAPFMAASAVLGPWGAGALFTADFAEQNRRDLRAQGMDNDQAITIGAIAAPLQAAAESLSNAFQLGRFPAVQSVLSRFTKPIGGGVGKALRYGQNGLLSLGTEWTEEQLQDNVIVPATQELFGALSSDVPQVDWNAYKQKAIAQNPQLLATLIPMALVFGGVMTSAQAKLSSVAVSSQDMLESAGFSAAQANEIRIQPNEEAQISKAREFWGNRQGTPQSMEAAAQSVGQRMRMLQGDAVAAQKDLEQRGILPRMLHAADNQWRLSFNDGSTADFGSHSEADAARWQWTTDQLGKVHLATREALGQMEKNAAVGREFAVEVKPDQRIVTNQEAADDPAIQNRIDQAQVLEQFGNAQATAKALGNPDEVAGVILGSSVNEFKDGILRTTIRLYEGAHILTLVEEKLEGDAKQIVASKPGRAWMLGALRNYEQVSGDNLFTSQDDSAVTDNMMVEAWSHLGQSYLVGKSKKGAAIGKGGMRGEFANVLKSGMGGAMNAETQFFNAVWKRAAKLSKLKREGKLGDDLTAELEHQLGIDSQVSHETGAAQEAQSIIDTSGYSEETPGPNGETFSLGYLGNVRDSGSVQLKQVHLESTTHEREGLDQGSEGMGTFRYRNDNRTVYWHLPPGEVSKEAASAAMERKGMPVARHVVMSYGSDSSRLAHGETFSLAKTDPVKVAAFAEFGAKSLAEPGFVGMFTYRNVTDAEADEIVRQGGPDMRGFAHVMEANRIRHAFKSHSDSVVEAGLGQRALEKSDLPRFLEVLDTPDSITVVPGGRNNTKVMYRKAFPDGTMLVSERTLETSLRQSPRMNFKTAWVKLPPAGVSPNTSPVYTPGRQSNDPASAGQSQETFSIRSGDFASRMSAAFSPFQRSPEMRLMVGQVAKERALKLGQDVMAAGDVLRSVASIGKDARMREALAYDTRMKDYMDGLSEAGRQTLEHEPAGIGNDPLVSAMLDHGKLMSRSTAAATGKLDAKAGDYDNVPRLPPKWYSKGSGIAPDVMAEAMHQAGLLKDGHTGTLWDELGKRLAQASKDKAAYNEAQAAYKEAEKYARDASRAESDQWAEEQKKAAKSPRAVRDQLKAWLRLLDGILAAAPPEVRAKVGGYVKLAGLATDEAMLKEVERRIEKLGVELEKWLKKEGIAQIERLFKKAAPDSTAGKRDKGKDADMHHLFKAAQAAAKMDAVAVAGEMARLDSLIAGDTLTPEQEALATTERGLVELLGDLKHADSGRVHSALGTLNDIYTGGWLKWKLRQIERREERAGMRHAFITDTGKSGVKKERQAMEAVAATLLGKIKGGFLSLSSFHEVLSYAFGEQSERVKSLVDAERDAAGQYEDANQALADELQDLFTTMAGGSVLKGEQLRFQMAKQTIETPSEKLSQFEAIQALLMWRQEDGQRHMEGTRDEQGKVTSSWSYDQAWIDDVTAKLTPEARQVMAWITAKYGAEHATLNPLYRERYGVNLPAHDNYAPITVAPVQSKGGETVDPVTGSAMSNSSVISPGSLRTRSRSAIAEPEFRDAVQVLLAHSRQLEYWKAYYDLAVETNAILGNREVQNAVKAKGGDEAASALRKWVDAIAQGGFRDVSAGLAMNQALNRMMGRAATVGLLGRFSTLLVQSTQLAAAAVKMPVGAYVKSSGRLWAGIIPGLNSPNIWGDAMRSEFIQRRYKSAPPIVRQAMGNLATATKPSHITRTVRWLGQLLSGADALFTGGTYAMLLDYHRGTGKLMGLSGAELEQHAHTEAERDTEQVAQPTRMATRSLMEITSTNPLAKVGWAYASEARQKIALAAWAASHAKADPVRFAKTAFLVFGVGGLLTTVLKNLWKDAKGDDDEKKWSAERLIMATLANPFHGIPGVSLMSGDAGMLSSLKWTPAALKDIWEGEADMKDIDTVISAMGLFFEPAAGIATLSHAGLDAAKLIENLTE